ncbi:MAG: RagB/SusD family nutrient uptake outer membrane protein [Chitinophagaceae bacterium]|nr:MAG: RagB/SusD family nutrient uptake outer membrane protein [Chitinophagaceae bacterium]
MAKYILLPMILLGSFTIGCRKIIEIDPPSNSITTSQVFTSDQQATAVAASIYSELINNTFGFANGGLTLFSGMSADELTLFNLNPDDDYGQFQTNSLNPNNTQIYLNLWSKPYSAIYKANSLIEGLNGYSGVSDSVKNELIGEAKFVRAFCHFYLLNLFGDIPLVLTINYSSTSRLSRSNPTTVYEQIIADLYDAKERLPNDYGVGKGERIIPNRGAATALLARVYLYKKDYLQAIEQSSEVINQTSRYQLVNINDVFLKNSLEAIWQLQQDNTGLNPGYNATYEGLRFIPTSSSANPFIVFRNTIVESFQSSDLRRNWIDSSIYAGIKYYFPYKYKIGASQSAPNATIKEYYMVLRLAEQYLIRAEAYANLNNIPNAVSDLNVIRQRAGLSPLLPSIPTNALNQEILDQRKLELVAEWGHRWFDLKRTNQANAVLGPIKSPNWQPTDLLYPIPLSEIQSAPNIVQNEGY